MYLRGVRYTFSLRVNVSDDCRISDLTLGNVFFPAPKHMIRLSVDYRQDSKIPIRLWKCFVEDTPNSHDGKAEFSAANTPVFSVTRSFKT